MIRLYYITLSYSSSILEKAKENLKAAQEKQCEDYNRKHANPSVYALGAKMLVKGLSMSKEEGR